MMKEARGNVGAVCKKTDPPRASERARGAPGRLNCCDDDDGEDSDEPRERESRSDIAYVGLPVLLCVSHP